MAFFIGKAHHFIFDRRAVTRAYTFDFTAIHRGTVNIARNDFVRFFISIGQPTYVFITIDPFIHKGEGVMMCIAFLNLHIFKVKRAFIYTSWRTSLKAHQLNAIVEQRLREMFCYALTIWATNVIDIADEDFAFQVGTCTKNNSLSTIEFAKFCNNTCYLAVLNLKLCYHDLLNIEVLCIFNGLFHQMLVFDFIRLAAQGMHCRAFTHVEHTHLNSRSICVNTHLTA